ncbi:hypothetical protein [Streptomyces hokutonensis]
MTVEEAERLAAAKTEKFGRLTPNSLFIDEQTAQQAVYYVQTCCPK